jgi:predicted site-specific integrase-resolvase
MSDNSRMVTLASVARRLNRTPSTLQKWANLGEFPRPMLLNKRRYLLEDQVAEWLRNRHASVGIKHQDGDREPARA